MKSEAFILSILTSLIILIFITHLPMSLKAQEGYVIKKLKFEGNETFSNRTLFEQIMLRSHSGLRRLQFWKDPFRFDENLLQRDLKRLERFYQTEGFLNATASYVLVKDDKHETVNLVIKILEGETVIINKIQYEFITDELENQQKTFKKIQPLLLVREKTRFRDQAVQQDEQTIVKAYSNHGFPYIKVRNEINVNQNKNSVDLMIYLDIGPKCTFGHTDVFGNKNTPTSIILKRVGYLKGQTFSQELIQKSQREIYKLGVFQYVTIKVPMNENNAVLPVQIVVKEAPRLTTKFGVGYGKEDLFRAFIDLRFLGFLGGIRRLTLFAKHSGLEPYHFNIKFSQPGIITSKTSLSLNPFVKREREPGFTIDRIGNNFTLQQHFSTTIDGYVNYTLEQDNLKVSSMTREQAFNNKDFKPYNKSSIAIGFAHDSSNPAFFPTEGMFNAITYTLSGIGFQSDFHFMRLLLEIRRYQKISEGWTFAYRAKLGWLKPTSGDEFTPIEERFYAGGSTSVRGWARSRLGPISNEGRPIGGNSYFEGSGEIRYPIWNKLTGVAFIDFGNVWQPSSAYVFSELHYAGGLGLRFKTPIGPIRFDVAVPVFEGKEPVQFHISVGQSF